MQVANHGEVLRALGQELAAHGFDVLGAVAVDAYNDALAAEHAHYRLPVIGHPRAMVAVIGNEKRLWPLFLRAYASTSLRDEAHPLDAYSRIHITRAAGQVAERFGLAHALRYSFDPPPQAVAIQRLAVLAGVAEASPVGLCVNPVHGPWFSLRAAVVFSLPGPGPSACAPTCSRCVQRPCVARRQDAIERSGVPASAITREHFQAEWRAWLAVRDACPLGRTFRYGDAQVRYHYTKDRSALSE